MRQAARAFDDAEILSEFWTTIARGEKSGWDKLLPSQITAELRRRSYDSSILAKTKSRPGREFARLISGKLKLSKFSEHETGRFSYDAVAQHFDRQVAQRIRRGGVDAVYAYEDSALQSFRSAEQNGTKRIYELPIGHWRLARRVFTEEAELHPEWAPTLEGLRDSDAKLARKDKEAQLAEKIIVPSQFVADSLRECPNLSAKVSIVNYGCPDPVACVNRFSDGPLKVLFVGSLGARKGLNYLLEAVKGLDVELTLVGPKPHISCKALDEGTAKHRYLGSIPRERVLEEMASNEVFVFPTLFEGLANVLLESLSQGLVPITTANSGAVGVIEDGEDGFIVPIRNVEAIREKLHLLQSDRERLFEMRLAAVKKATERSWAKYREQLLTVVQGGFN